MLYDKSRDRILHEDGSSEFSVDSYCEKLIKGSLGEKDYCIESYDTDLYEKYYGESISLQDIPEWPENNRRYTDWDLEFVKRRIFQSSRFQRTDQEHQRVKRELDFFEKTNNIQQVKKLIHLIDKFREEGIVWGVGRGSSCASYVFYLLGVHDVDPLRHHIPFEEMSKEDVA